MGGSSGSAMRAWGRNNVVRLQLLLLPLNVVLLSLCGPDGCFSLTPTSYDFLCVEGSTSWLVTLDCALVRMRSDGGCAAFTAQGWGPDHRANRK